MDGKRQANFLFTKQKKKKIEIATYQMAKGKLYYKYCREFDSFLNNTRFVVK
jgi:hypothetical protein